MEIVTAPASLLTCADEPEVPELPDQTQQLARDQLTLDYILLLREAWADCRGKVDGLREWSEALD